MTWAAAFAVFVITVVISFPSLIGGAMFGQFLGEPGLRRTVAEVGAEFWQVAALGLMTVVPNLVGGLFSGGLAMAVARRLMPDSDTVAVVGAASGLLAIHLLLSPLIFPESALMPKAVQATGAVTAYVLVAMALGDLDDLWRQRMRRVWMALLMAAMVECAVAPVFILQELEMADEEE